MNINEADVTGRLNLNCESSCIAFVFSGTADLGPPIGSLHLLSFLRHTVVEPVLKDYTMGHANVVSGDRWSLVAGSITLRCRTFRQKYVVFQCKWSFMPVVSQDRFHCNRLHVIGSWPQYGGIVAPSNSDTLPPNNSLHLRFPLLRGMIKGIYLLVRVSFK